MLLTLYIKACRAVCYKAFKQGIKIFFDSLCVDFSPFGGHGIGYLF